MRSNRLSDAATALGYGVLLAAGQWLIAVIGIAIISVIAAGRLDLAVIIDFRMVIVFAMMIAMISVAPIALVATRLVSDALHAHAPQNVPGLCLGPLVAASILAICLGTFVFFGVMKLELEQGLATLVILVLFAQLWVLAGFAGTLQQMGWVIFAYLLGGMVSIIGAIWAGFADGSATHMVFGYATGIAITVALLLWRVMRSFPFPVPIPRTSVSDKQLTDAVTIICPPLKLRRK